MKEHPGRARGVGSVPWKVAFPDDAAIYRKRSHTRKSVSLDAIVEARVQEVVQERMRDQQERFREESERMKE